VTPIDDDITELVVLDAQKVSAVASPANGADWLVLKSAADDDAEKSGCAEADQFEEEVTKDGEVSSKALSAADRKAMPTSSFAFVDKKGGKHLPIHDEAHAKAALSRFGKQDFSEAKGKPADAKQAAARKIKSAAKKHSVEVSDDTDVATAAKKGAVQDALGGTATPQEAGHLETGHSQTAGSVTAGTRTPPTSPSTTLGGETTTVIPDESKVISKGIVVASLVQAMDALDEQRAAVKDGKYLQDAIDALPDPKVPLTELTSTLASCVGTLEEYLLCERVEAAVDPSERNDVWDLEDAKCALESALRLVAIFATMESLEDVNKSLDDEQLLAVQKTLDEIVEVTKAGDSASPTEEILTMDITKNELAETIAASSVEAVKQAFKDAKDAEVVKVAEEAEAAEKNANNGGDISEADIKPTKETDADDVDAVKSEDKDDEPEAALSKAVSTQLETLTKGLADVQKLVTKIAKRPRAGGPSLDGQPRVAAEGRQGDVTKSTEGAEIEKLQKSLDEATTTPQKENLQLQLIHARLMKAHEDGRL
jgi:hypothetical protein